MQWLAALCVRRPVFAWVLVLSLTVVGLFAFGRLGVDRFPNVDIPTIVVTTRLPGAAPEQIETEVTDKIEEAVNTISGIDTLSSTSSEGISQVIVSFKLEKDADVAAQEVRDRVNRVLPLLPRTALQPTVEKLDPTASPVITVAVTADKPVRDITEFADKVLRRRLESSDGVGQVLVIGGRKRQINVWLDADAAARPGPLGQRRGARAAGAERRRARRPPRPGRPVGHAAHARPRRHRSTASATSCCAKWPATRCASRDVARVEDGMAEPATQASVNGVATVLLQIRKQSGTNTVEVANNVKQRLADLQPILPPGYQLRIVRDEAQFIEASIAAVQEHLVVGSILAAIVVFLFLGNLRSTVIAAIAIPTSIIATFALIWYMGFTLNMLTMLALTLSVGIVIDDAIVVLENIFRFIEEKGMAPMEAAVEATREIGLAVLATTFSLVAIFVPVGFMSGIVGRFMQSFGLTMAFAMLVSLFVSFTLTPMMSAHWLKPAAAGTHSRDSKHNRLFDPLDRGYTRLLEWAMAHRGLVAVGTVLVLLSSVPLFQRHGRELHARGRPVAVRRHAARARGHQPGRHGRAGQPARARPIRQHPRGRLHARHRGRRHRGHAEHGVDAACGCMPIEDARPRPVRGHGRGARRDPAGVPRGRHPHGRAGRWRSRRRRRRHPVHGAGPRSEDSSRSTARRCARRRWRFPGSSTSTPRSTPASPSCRSTSTGPRRPTSACRWPTPPRRCACWSPATR